MNIFNLFKNLRVRDCYLMNFMRMATFSPRDFSYTYSDTGTLMNRFVCYIGSTKSKSDTLEPIQCLPSKTFLNSEIFREELQKTTNEQLVDLVIKTDRNRSNGCVHSYTHFINDLDAECNKRVKQLNVVDTLTLLYGFMNVIQGRVSRMTFYKNAMEALVENFNNSPSIESFVQICFYLGMWKKNRHTDALMTRFVDEHLIKYLKSLSTIEFCIICTALYKTSIRRNSKEFSERLQQEIILMNLPIDVPVFVTFVKSCRHNSITSHGIKERIKDLLLISHLDRLSFMSMVHLFAYFAQNLSNDKDICQQFVEKCMDKIRYDYRSYNQSDMRGKDFGTFLWCCAQLNLNILKQEELRLIEDRILEKVSRGEYKYNFVDLIDASLSLWILNHKSEKLIQHAFYNANIFRPKLDYRANLLKSCVQIESPEFLKDSSFSAYDSHRSSPKYMRDKSPNLIKVFHVLRKIGYDFGIRRNHIVSPINFFYAPGIRVEFENGNEINLEIIESNQLLDDGKTPTGLFDLKTRILKRCGCTVKQINISNRSEDELTTYIKTALHIHLRSCGHNRQEY